jgi:hypothetical protein
MRTENIPLPEGATYDAPTTQSNDPPLPPGASFDAPPLPSGATTQPPARSSVFESGTKKKGLIETLKPYVSEGAFGAAVGAITPELTTGAGMVASAFPVTAPMAPYLLSTGTAMRGARLAAAGTGLLSGIGGEAGAQIAESYGKPEKVQELARLAGGIVTPEFGNLIKYAAGKVISSALPIVTKSDLKSIVGAIADDLGIKEKDLSPTQRQYIENVAKQIRGGTKSDAPLQSTYSALERGAEQIVDNYNRAAITFENQANKLLELAKQGPKESTRIYGLADDLSANAQKLVETAKERANAVLRNAEKRAAEIQAESRVEGGRSSQMAGIDAQDVLSRSKKEAETIIREGQERAARLRQVADNARASAGKRTAGAGESLTEVGTAQLPTQTGTAIRDQVMPFFNKLKEIRSQNAEKFKAEAFNYAALKEQQGQKVKDTKAFTEAMDELKRDINTATLGAIKEPLKNIKRALDPRVVDESTGVVTGKDATFESLEQLRRFLRDRSYGLPAEGFDAINQQMAGKLANAVEKIQLEFSPGIEKFLQQYATDSQPLSQFKTKLGKAVVGAEEFDMGRFVTDPADIASKFFRTETGVKDLINLLGGNTAGAEQIARGYVLDKLRDPSAKNIKSFIDSSRDWLPQFPQLQAQLQAAAQRIGGAETVAQKRGTLSDALRSKASTLLDTSTTQAGKVTSAAEKRALELEQQGRKLEADLIRKGEVAATKEMTAGAKEAGREVGALAKQLSAEGEQIRNLILGDKFGAERVKDIILSGSPRLWDEIGPIIAKDPKAKETFVEAIRQVIADKAATSPSGAVDAFNRRVRPAIEKSGLMNNKELSLLQAKIDQINRTVEGPQKPGLIQRAITNALTTEAARGLSSALNFDPLGFVTDRFGAKR